MKKLLLIITLMLTSYIVDAQIINLVKDDSYAVSNNWSEIFDNFKKLTVFDDGTAMISHANENRYSLFDKNGKWLKDIKIYFEDGKKKPFNLQPVFGKINNLYFTKNNSQGKIYFFNDNGLIINEITVDCSIHDMIPLNEKNIAIYGGVSWKTQWRDFIAILDIETGKYKIIFDCFEDITGKKSDYSIYAKAHLNKKPGVVKVADNLIVATPMDGVMKIYDFDGNKISERKFDWNQKTLSVDEQKKMQSEAIKKYKKEFPIWQSSPDPDKMAEIQQDFVKRLEKGMDYITEPLSLSWFTMAINGAGENILYFEDAEETGQNKFHKYSMEQGRTLSENSFQCAEFNLEITKNRFIIKNGYIFGVQELKDSKGELRLVRFKL